MTLLQNRPQRLNGNKGSLYGRLFLLILVVILVGACGSEDEPSSPNTTNPTPASSPTPSVPTARVIVPEAFVLAFPQRDAEIIISLFQGDLRQILGRTAPDRLGDFFYEVDLGTRSGWVLSYQVEAAGDLTSLTTVDETAFTPTLTLPTIVAVDNTTPSPSPERTVAAGYAIGRVSVPRASVLANFSRESTPLGFLLEGEEVTIGALTTPDGTGTSFYGIEYGDQIGWVIVSQLTIVAGDVAQLQPIFLATSPATVNTPSVFVAPTLSPTSRTPTPFPPSVFTVAPTLTYTPIPLSPTATLEAGAFPAAESPTPAPVVDVEVIDPPPLNMSLPEGWESQHIFFGGGPAGIKIALSIYQGPLPDGLSGTLWLVWGFPNLAPPTGELDMWSDGVFYLRNLLFIHCNIGVDLNNRQLFPVGQYEGTGTYYSAVDCGDAADIAGWFAALQVSGGNYAFYIGIEPVERVTQGLPYMQDIMDSISFNAVEEDESIPNE